MSMTACHWQVGPNLFFSGQAWELQGDVKIVLKQEKKTSEVSNRSMDWFEGFYVHLYTSEIEKK